MRKGEQITLVLWTLVVLLWLVILFRLSTFDYSHFDVPVDVFLFFYGIYATVGAGAWTFVYFVYRIARWASTRDKVEVMCECGHVNLVPVIEVFHTYENIKCEKCGRALQNHETSA